MEGKFIYMDESTPVKCWKGSSPESFIWEIDQDMMFLPTISQDFGEKQV